MRLAHLTFLGAAMLFTGCATKTPEPHVIQRPGIQLLVNVAD